MTHAEGTSVAAEAATTTPTRPSAAAGAVVRWVKNRHGVLGVAVALALWQAAISLGLLGGNLGHSMTPAAAGAALWRLAVSGELLANAWPSLQRVGVGLLTAAAIGIPVGLAVGYHKRIERSTYVVFQFLRMVSPLAWMPIAIMALGVGDKAVYFLVGIAAVWPMIINTAHGTSQVDRSWLRMGRTFGAGTAKLFTRIIIPSVMPDILMGIRLALGISWVILVPAEMLGVSSGLGYFILDTRDRFAYDELVAVILAIGAIGYTLDSGLRRLRSRFAWKAAEER